ncbi:hypothetical protein LXA43DRAFT_975946 [Ganoderma leucocontextum]|nr:hypothetical protein LXA43DRAFT_975946 [Ganoderma leucocontextum]
MDMLPETASELRRIRNFDICSAELSPLLRNSTLKIPGGTLNVFAAVVQDVANRASSQQRDFVLFSSWIGAIASGQRKDGGYEGTLEEHVIAACCDGDKADAQGRPRWAMPLCGGDPAHWVFGWADFDAEEYGIVDSMPALGSALTWAKPSLHAGVDRIRGSLGMSPTKWDAMSFTIRSPRDDDQQTDCWSCGLFVMIAMQAFVDGWQGPLLGRCAIACIRDAALTALLKIARKVHRDESCTSTDNVAMGATGEAARRCTDDGGEAKVGEPKCKRIESDEARERRAEAAKGERKQRRTREERREALEADDCVEKVEAHRVLCGRCHDWIQLHQTREYETTNWDAHRQRCAQITGVRQHPSDISGSTPSIRNFFTVVDHQSASATQTRTGTETKSTELTRVACKNLRGPEYLEYILRTQTRGIGGVSSLERARVLRELFPYKRFPETKNLPASSPVEVKMEVPDDGNTERDERKWTRSEQRKLDHELQSRARWEVHYDERYIKAKRCEGMTSKKSEICDACENLAKNDEGFKKSLKRKNDEAELPEDEQLHIRMQRGKFAPNMFQTAEARTLEALMKDPLTLRLWQRVERDESTAAFVELYTLARNGHLANHSTFVDICAVLAENVRRRMDANNPKLRNGVRYSRDYLNFMLLMRSYGQRSAQQYSILTSQITGPSPRTLRYLVRKSEDCLSNPDIHYENMARVKRLMDARGYTGPVVVVGDCTKVRKRLAYSTDFGAHVGHVIGSTLPLSETQVENTEDIDRVVAKITEDKELASQTRAILAKIPLPQIPPLVVALLPTKGNDTAEGIHEQHMRLLAMARQLNMSVIAMSADGAASEIGAQSMMDHEQSDVPPLVYEYPLYGISLRAPVFETTGPLISLQDPLHTRKTCRNQPQHGTHTASLGRGYLVNRTLVQLYETHASGLLLRDVENVDKQDDGAARRLFHLQALSAMTHEKDGEVLVREEFRGLFVYDWVFAKMFEAYDNPKMAVTTRLLSAFRTRFFLQIWSHHIAQMSQQFPDLYKRSHSFISAASFNIFNRLCDALILLILAYSRFYPDQPFCPWLFGTEFVEHFFGLARTYLPDFTYAELLKLVKHVMLRQKLLLSGKYTAQKERNSGTGYILDYDPTPLTAAEVQHLRVPKLPVTVLHQIVELAYTEAGQIAKQLLFISPPSLPLKHIPLRAPPGARRSRKTRPKEDDDSDGDEEALEADDEENEAISEPVTGGMSAATDPSQVMSMDVGPEVADSASYAARYAALSEVVDAALEQATDTDVELQTHTAPPIPDSTTWISAPTSKIFDENKKVSIALMLADRERDQSKTATRSECPVHLDPKFSLEHVLKPDTKMSVREASHHVRVTQDLAAGGKIEKTARELRWQAAAQGISQIITNEELPNIASKNVSALHPIHIGSFLVMKNDKRMYLGEVLDMYKKGKNRHGSVTEASSCNTLSFFSLRTYVRLELGTASTVDAADDDDISRSSDGEEAEELLFTCRSSKSGILTHAPAHDLLYHLGVNVTTGSPTALFLKPAPAARWLVLAKAKVQEQLKSASKSKGRRKPKAGSAAGAKGEATFAVDPSLR